MRDDEGGGPGDRTKDRRIRILVLQARRIFKARSFAFESLSNLTDFLVRCDLWAIAVVVHWDGWPTMEGRATPYKYVIWRCRL